MFSYIFHYQRWGAKTCHTARTKRQVVAVGVTDTASCMESDKSRCSWLRNQQTCTRLCRCINSNNQGLQEKGAVSKRKGCTCGSLNKVKARRLSCQDHVERKSRCPCLRVGVKCDSVCRCTNCGNGKDCPDKRCSNTTPSKRKRTNPQTYKRMRGADYLAKQGFTVSSGLWTKLESIFLSVVIEVIDSSGVVLNSKNIAELYNFVVSSDKVKEIGMAITYKSLSGIAGKLFHLKEKHFLHLSLMNTTGIQDLV